MRRLGSIWETPWPALEQAFERWIDPRNFDEQGGQRTRLSGLTAPLASGAFVPPQAGQTIGS